MISIAQSIAKKILLTAASVVCMSTMVFAQAVPSVQVEEGGVITPSAGNTYYGAGIVHTSDVFTGRRTEIKELAKALKNDPDLIYQYVRDNVETLPMFGLKKGAMGAIIDHKGTSWDQAHLMVELVRESGFTARYRTAMFRFTAAQVQSWYGLPNMNDACKLLRDGGFPFWMNGGGHNCDYTGTKSLIDVMHVVVEVNIGGTYYAFDPSFKTQTHHAGIDIAAAMGHNQTTLTNGAAILTGSGCGAVTCVHQANPAGLENALKNQATTLVTNLRSTANYDKSIKDIVGGVEVEPVDLTAGVQRIALAALPGYNNVYRSITGDVPDQYRTRTQIQYIGTTKNYYLDELYGRRLWFNKNVNNIEFNIGHRKAWSAAYSSAAVIKVIINHPYAATSGTYMDRTAIFNPPFSVGTRMALVISSGHAGAGLKGRLVDNDYQSLDENTTWDAVIQDTLANTQINIAASWMAQQSRLISLADGVMDNRTLVHDSVAVIAGDGGGMVKPYADFPGHMSLIGVGKTATERVGAIETLTHAMNALEGGVLEQFADTYGTEPESATTISLLAKAVREGSRIYDVPQGQLSSITGSLTGYDSGELTRLTDDNTAHSLILPQNGNLTQGSFTGTSYIVKRTGANWLGHLVDDGTLANRFSLKGAFVEEVDTVYVEEVINLSQAAPSSLAAGGAKASGTDIKTGGGQFPYSLAFTRGFRNETRDGIPSGWTHNFDITGRFSGNGAIAMGGRSPVDAVRVITAIHATYDYLKSSTDVKHTVFGVLAMNWMQKGLRDNIFTLHQGHNELVFARLPDGGFNAPDGDLSDLSIAGSGLNQTVTFTGREGTQMILAATEVTARDFRMTNWDFPTGMSVTFAYQDLGVSGNLLTVANNRGRSLAIHTSPTGNLFEVTDDNARLISYILSQTTNDITSVKLTVGAETITLVSYSYDGGGTLNGISTPAIANVVDYTHNALGQMTASSAAGIGTTNFLFATGWRSEFEDPSGATTSVLNDPYGRWSQTTNGEGQTSRFEYDRLGRLTKAIAPDGNYESYSYDKYYNRLTATATPKAGSGLSPTTINYSYFGASEDYRLKTVNDGSGGITDFTYDATTNQIATITAPSVSINGGAAQRPVTTFAYTIYGQPDLSVDPNGVRTKFTYNAKAELTQTKADEGAKNITTSFTYDVAGRLKTTTNHRGKVTTNTYNLRGQVTKTQAPESVTTDFVYDTSGRVTDVKRTLGAGVFVTKQGYDDAGRVIWSEDNALRRTDIVYDDVARTVQVTSPDGRIGKRFFDAAGRVNKVIRGVGTPEEITEETGYNVSGTTAWVEDGNDVRTDYEYDGFNRLTKTDYFGTTKDEIINSYDALGRPTSMTTRAGQAVTVSYDNMSRILTRTTAGVGTYSYQYDKRSQVTKITFAPTTGGSETVIYTYDSLGRLKDETGAYGYKMVNIYNDTSGTLDKRYNYPGIEDNYFVRYTPDDLGRVASVKEMGTVNVATYTYDQLSRVTQIALGNGNVTSKSYDSSTGLLDSLTLNPAGTADDVTFSYTRDEVGNITNEHATNINYVYNPTASTGTTNYAHNGLNQVTTAGASTISYDDNGNMSNDGTFSYTFNAQNQLTQAKLGATVVGSYGYDALGRRKTKTAGSTTTRYLWGGSQIYAEYTGANTLVRRYVYGPGIDQPLMIKEANGTKTYLHMDGKNNVVATANNSGTITDKFTMSPWGEGVQSETGSPYKYTARRTDEETGNIYYRNRYYQPKLGRFMSADPIGYGDGLNMYAYVGNNPVNFRDPTGLMADDDYVEEIIVTAPRLPTCPEGAVCNRAGIFFNAINQMAGFFRDALNQGFLLTDPNGGDDEIENCKVTDVSKLPKGGAPSKLENFFRAATGDNKLANALWKATFRATSKANGHARSDPGVNTSFRFTVSDSRWLWGAFGEQNAVSTVSFEFDGATGQQPLWKRVPGVAGHINAFDGSATAHVFAITHSSSSREAGNRAQNLSIWMGNLKAFNKSSEPVDIFAITSDGRNIILQRAGTQCD